MEIRQVSLVQNLKPAKPSDDLCLIERIFVVQKFAAFARLSNSARRNKS